MKATHRLAYALAFATLALLSMPARAVPVFYSALLSGAAENPVTLSAGTGTAVVGVDGNIMTLNVQFAGLTTPVTIAHIHCCVAPPGNVGVATPVPTLPGFPTAVSGTYSNTFNLLDSSTYNPAFVAANGGSVDAARTALLNGFNSGTSYLNLHTTTNPGGEIRGFLVPEPGSMLLLGAGLVGMMVARRRKPRAN